MPSPKEEMTSPKGKTILLERKASSHTCKTTSLKRKMVSLEGKVVSLTCKMVWPKGKMASPVGCETGSSGLTAPLIGTLNISRAKTAIS